MGIKTGNPLVSIYIPTHNRSALLVRAVESVLNQTYQNIEILICDDGSCDDTEEVVRRLIEQYSSIKYFKHNTPQGACAARNVCINNASGYFCTGLDDDDIFHPSRVEKLVEYYDESFSLVTTKNIEVDLSQFDCVYQPLPNDALQKQSINLSFLLDENLVGNQVFTETSRFKILGGFDESLPAWQDYDMWVRIVDKFGDALKIDVETYYADIDEKRPRISTSSNRYKGCKKFYNKHWSKLSSYQKKNAKIRMAIIGGQFPSFWQLIKLFNLPMIKFWLKALCLKYRLVSK
ncbi:MULTISPECIES: glycosyltransferase [Thalassotalea]|uniref:glycosyltransferase n=1 Tax=Thalassotalea TaxID=1518149 RepID=UPI000943F276|nr:MULTISPECIES: glycosyltransferase [Thalassotalea]OKY24646.1 hypothetical protein BI291_05485 [Thalassotalea sp. PP2-459]